MPLNRHLDQRLKLHHFRAIDAIASRGSLLKAATALAITQPALSKSLREAEDILRAKLFERHPRGARPTAAGNAVADAARRLSPNCGVSTRRSTRFRARAGARSRSACCRSRPPAYCRAC